MNKEIKRIILVLAGLCILLISLVAYLSYFQIFKAESIKINSYNKRLWINEEKVLRGSIIDRNGKILAYSEKEGDSYKRYYNYDNLYSHIIGYSYREYGKVGLELQYNNTLLNMGGATPLGELKSIVIPNTEGNMVKLSIDHQLQEYTRKQLEGKKGSAIAMNPTTGEIYSMISLPDFNPSTLREDWKAVVEDGDSPLLNRATSGLYIPGSAFKIITSIAAIETPGLDREYVCDASINIEGYIFKDYEEKGHGKIGLQEALVQSCNTYFAEKGTVIGKEKLGEVADRFMVNKKIPFDLPVTKSLFSHKDNMSKIDIAAASIGQGKVLVTPLNMALIVSGIANKGEIMKPFLVKEIISAEGKTVEYRQPETISKGTDLLTSNEIKNMMVASVNSGTSKNAGIKNIRVAGKTGTAENPSGKTHAWFIGFAPADEPKIAVVVIMEEEGSTGGKAAAPIARNIILEGLNSIK